MKGYELVLMHLGGDDNISEDCAVHMIDTTQTGCAARHRRRSGLCIGRDREIPRSNRLFNEASCKSKLIPRRTRLATEKSVGLWNCGIEFLTLHTNNETLGPIFSRQIKYDDINVSRSMVLSIDIS